MWKIQQLSELYIEEPRAGETCSDLNGTKALGLKCSTLPLAYISSWLPFAFLFPSQHLCLILLSPQFPHLQSLIPSWSLGLFLCLQLLSFIFPIQPNCLGSNSKNPYFFILHLRISFVSLLLPWLYSQWGLSEVSRDAAKLSVGSKGADKENIQK